MRKLSLIFLLAALIFSCKKDDEYPFVQSPYIEFEDLKFYNSQSFDTLELSFIVWDREGDVGLSSVDITYPYHQYDVVLDVDGNLIESDSPFNPPFTIVPGFFAFDEDQRNFRLFIQEQFSTEFAMSEYPTLNCEDYAITDDSGHPQFLSFINRNNLNLFVNFLEANNTEYNFRELFGIAPDQSCGLGFDARLLRLEQTPFLSPIEIQSFRVTRLSQYSYKVDYMMMTFLFPLAFQDKQFEVQFQVADRELNESNVATSGLVTLEEITIE